MSRFLALAMALGCLSNPLSARVWTVAWLGGGDFSNLPPAVAAATPGDTILVGLGFYDAPLVDKPLRILGVSSTPGYLPFVQGGWIVRGIPYGGAVLIQGLHLRDTACAGGREVLRIELCSGQVVFRECSFDGIANCVLPVGSVIDASRVVLARCTVDGASAVQPSGTGRDLFHVTRSTIEAYGCFFAAGSAALCRSAAGGIAWSCDAHSELLFSDVLVRGGDGSSRDCMQCSSAVDGPGAPAIAGGRVELFGGGQWGGQNGAYRCILSNPTSPRVPAVQGAVSLRSRASALPGLTASGRLQPGGSTVLQATVGVSGLSAYVMALGLRPLELPGLDGTLWIDLATSNLIGVVQGAPSSTASLRISVIADPWILGTLLAFQVFDGLQSLSEPLAIVVH